MSTLKERMERLPRTRRGKVEARAAELVAEEMTLRDLRKAMAQTQERRAQQLGIKQENVSRIEQRTDLLISTLRGYVEAMGGKLHLIAQFEGRPAIEVSGLAAMGREKDASRQH